MARLLLELDTALEVFARDGFGALRDAWRTRCVHMQATVQLVSEFAAPLEGRCLDVDHDGALLLLTESGVQRVVSGDVSLRRA
jgi:BirA family biotin operon repressor/biotin-[acetyl-CoA-carboxylase] ligase